MNTEFQDRIDQYLLHKDKMSEEEKKHFLDEIEQDGEKKAMFEFNCKMKDAICSRCNKLNAINTFKRRKSVAKKKNKVWIIGIAAMIVCGLFAIAPQFLNIDKPQNVGDSKQQIMRGNDDIFDSDDYDCLDKSRFDLSDSICDENNPDSIFCQK